MLEAAGVPPKHLMAYMLCGYDKAETWDRIWRRFHRMTERRIAPYPMVFDKRERPRGVPAVGSDRPLPRRAVNEYEKKHRRRKVRRHLRVANMLPPNALSSGHAQAG